jgi:hypothetical protein
MTKLLRLHKLQIENFMRIKGLTVDARGNHVIIRGANEQGKTSALEAIWAAVCGANAKEIPEPLHRGQRKGLITVDLGELVVERHFTERGTRLVVLRKDGSEIASPQALLNGLLSKIALNPVDFLSLRPQDQLDQVLRVAGLTPPRDQVRLIAGEDIPPHDQESAYTYLERLSADHTGLFYLRRLDQGREVDRCKKALEKQEELVKGFDTTEPGRDVAEVLAEIEAAEEEQKGYESQRRTVVDGRNKLKAYRERLAEVEQQCDRKRAEVADLEARLKKALAEWEELKGKAASGATATCQLEAEIADEVLALGALTDHGPRIAGLKEEAKRCNAQQEENIRVRQASERLGELAREQGLAEEKHRRLDAQLEDLRRLRKQVLEGANLGVPGLSVGSGELLVNGVSFKQAARSKKLRVACAVAMKNPANLRLLRVDDAEHLDENSRNELLDMADDHGFQVVMTCVDSNDGLKVEIEEAAQTADVSALDAGDEE